MELIHCTHKFKIITKRNFLSLMIQSIYAFLFLNYLIIEVIINYHFIKIIMKILQFKLIIFIILIKFFNDKIEFTFSTKYY